MSNIKKLTEQANKYGSITVTLDVNEVMALLKERDALSVECATLNEFALGLYSPDGTSRVEGEDLPKTPATDAYLNSVRAEGVNMFAAHLRTDKTDVSVCKLFALGADDFAAQLRAGKDGE